MSRSLYFLNSGLFLPRKEGIFSSDLRKVAQNPLNRYGSSSILLRAARVQNETAPEKLLNRYEKRFEKCEKGSEKRSETRLKKI